MTAVPLATNRAPLLTMTGAALAYGRHRALHGIDLALRPGETLALLGPNGAGKTSLMRLAAGRLAPDSGSVRVGDPTSGGDPVRETAVRRRIGYVPQEIGLYPRLTAHENLDVFAQLAGLKGAGRRAAVARLIERCDVGAVAGTPVGALSGGYRRRVHLAASLLTDPELILLDEPTQGIDLEARAAIHTALAGFSAEGAAILISTHDFAEAERLADRAAVLVEGRLVREGTIDDLMRPYAHRPPQQEAVLDAAPSREAETALRRAGFTPGDGHGPGLRWTGLRPNGLEGGALLDSLRRQGVPAIELRLRWPGLEAFYRDSISGNVPDSVSYRAAVPDPVGAPT